MKTWQPTIHVVTSEVEEKGSHVLLPLSVRLHTHTNRRRFFRCPAQHLHCDRPPVQAAMKHFTSGGMQEWEKLC